MPQVSENLTHARRLTQKALAILGFSKPDGRDADIEQAVLRVAVTAIVLVYGVIAGLVEQEFSPELRIALVCGLITGTAGIWMLYRFRRDPARPAAMRSFGIAADLIPITAGLFWAGEIGVPLVGLYLWITVGNGFRFGPRYLLQSYALSGVCFFVLLFFAPFWQLHRAIGIGLAILLGTIPLYVLVLLSRLTAQKDAAEQLSNAKSRFVANVSHELRTPLTGVVAVHDLLLQRSLSKDDRELVATLGNAIHTLKLSVDAILQMSKLEAGAEQVVLAPFNLRWYLHELDRRIAPEALAKKLSWTCSVEPDVPGTFVGDESHLTHVVGNLVNNALKFTSSGNVQLRVTKTGTHLRFEVIDTGIGIPLAKQANIFERFVQADASATRRYGGTGLGTSIAHDLVKLMGGTIGLKSEEGQGSNFWFELPLISADLPIPRFGLASDTRVINVLSENSEDAHYIVSAIDRHGARTHALSSASVSEDRLSIHVARASVLLMSPESAIAFAKATLKSDSVCPWLLVSTTAPSLSQLRNLWSLGAQEILFEPTSDAQLCSTLGAIVSVTVPSKIESTGSIIPRRVLIADDNQSNLLLITRILEDAGHAVRAVERGDIAYDLMMSGQFDIALLDYNMPEMTGPDAVKLFRAGEVGSTEQLPVLIVSADATPVAKRISLEAGANGHVTKPVPGVELLGLISRLTADQPRRIERRAKKREYPKLVPPMKKASDIQTGLEQQLTDKVLVNSERLSELQKIAKDDVDFLRKYAAASFADVEMALAELRSALVSRDTLAARDALHKIDGTALNLGASALAQASKRMKEQLTDPDSTFAAQAAADLTSICALTKSAISAGLATPVIHERDGATGAT